jgi:hypothetical protein
MEKCTDIAIATTNFLYGKERVIVDVFNPHRAYNDSDEFVCKFSISGAIEHKGKAIGLDSMQALILSLSLIGDYIKNCPEVDRNLVEWEGGELKFPVL